MSKSTVIRKDTLTDIAEAIREKTETTELIPTVEMAQRIRDIETLPTDATATELDLLAGKVAYNNDGRFVGSIEEFNGDSVEENKSATDINIYKQIIEKTIEVFDLEMDIETISPYSFAGCYELNTVYIPESVKEIGNFAFKDCLNLKNIYLKRKNDVIIISVNGTTHPFTGCKDLTIHVPKEILSFYEDNYNWIQVLTKISNSKIVGDL